MGPVCVDSRQGRRPAADSRQVPHGSHGAPRDQLWRSSKLICHNTSSSASAAVIPAQRWG